MPPPTFPQSTTYNLPIVTVFFFPSRLASAGPPGPRPPPPPPPHGSPAPTPAGTEEEEFFNLHAAANGGSVPRTHAIKGDPSDDPSDPPRPPPPPPGPHPGKRALQ